MPEELISISKAAKLLGISTRSLVDYPEDVILPVKTNGGHRRYRISDVAKLQGIETKNDNQEEITCVYVRVSSQDQKEKGDLERQKARVLEFTSKHNYKVDYIFEEVGSGMNDNRSKLNKLFELVNNHKIKRVVIEHRDRLTRFNFHVFEAYFKSHGVEIEVMLEELNKSFEEELTKDLLGLMSSFSAKIYGRRSHQNRKK
jgi:predicted site-specific integrase-resolvase